MKALSSFLPWLASALLLAPQSINAQTEANDERRNQYGQVVERKKLSAEARDGILTFESADKSFKFWTDFRLNLDFTYHFDNYDNSKSPAGNANDAIQLSNGAHIRRARIAFKAQVSEKWYGEVDFDFSDGEIDLNDIYLKYNFTDALAVKIGHFREPMGMMTNTTSRYVTFMERPLASEFDPSRHLGVGATYAHPRFMAGLGIFSDEFLEAVTKDVRRKSRTGTEASVAVTGRIMGYLLNQENKTLGIGIGGSFRTPQITDEGAYTLRYRSNDENRTSQKRFFDTDVIDNVKNIQLYNVELAFAIDAFRLQAEYKFTNVNRGAVYSDINYTGRNIQDARFSGYYVEAAYFLSGQKQNFSYQDGEFTRVRPESKKGAWELAARFSAIDLNAKEANVYGGSGNITSLGLTWWAKTNVRIILNAAYVNHDDKANSKYNWAVPSGGFDYAWIGTRFEIDF